MAMAVGAGRAQAQYSLAEINDLYGVENVADDEITDHLEPYNRVMLDINLFLNRALLNPNARIYKKITPEPAQKAIANAVDNLSMPSVIASDVLQGKISNSGQNTARFFINSTLGVGGLFDVAALWDMPLLPNNFDTTFGKWGVAQGEYVVLPFFGPQTLRSSVALVPAYFTSLDTYLFRNDRNWSNGLTGVKIISNSAENSQNIIAVEDSSADYYATIRSVIVRKQRQRVVESN